MGKTSKLSLNFLGAAGVVAGGFLFAAHIAAPGVEPRIAPGEPPPAAVGGGPEAPAAPETVPVTDPPKAGAGGLPRTENYRGAEDGAASGPGDYGPELRESSRAAGTDAVRPESGYKKRNSERYLNSWPPLAGIDSVDLFGGGSRTSRRYAARGRPHKGGPGAAGGAAAYTDTAKTVAAGINASAGSRAAQGAASSAAPERTPAASSGAAARAPARMTDAGPGTAGGIPKVLGNEEPHKGVLAGLAAGPGSGTPGGALEGVKGSGGDFGSPMKGGGSAVKKAAASSSGGAPAPGAPAGAAAGGGSGGGAAAGKAGETAADSADSAERKPRAKFPRSSFSSHSLREGRELMESVALEKLNGKESAYFSEEEAAGKLDEALLKEGAVAVSTGAAVFRPGDPLDISKLSAERERSLKKEAHIFLKRVENRYGRMTDIYYTPCDPPAVCRERGLETGYLTMTTAGGAKLSLGLKYAAKGWRLYTVRFTPGYLNRR